VLAHLSLRQLADVYRAGPGPIAVYSGADEALVAAEQELERARLAKGQAS
jgi:hypothetical protein